MCLMRTLRSLGQDYSEGSREGGARKKEDAISAGRSQPIAADLRRDSRRGIGSVESLRSHNFAQAGHLMRGFVGFGAGQEE